MAARQTGKDPFAAALGGAGAGAGACEDGPSTSGSAGSAAAMDTSGDGDTQMVGAGASLESLKDQTKVAERKVRELRKAEEAAMAGRHWREKQVSEMQERDWRIFKEDFNISTRGSRVPHPLRFWYDEPRLFPRTRLLAHCASRVFAGTRRSFPRSCSTRSSALVTRTRRPFSAQPSPAACATWTSWASPRRAPARRRPSSSR